MRTTLTIDPDVAAEIESLRRQERRALKAIINDLLRLGLERYRDRARRPQKVREYTKSMDLGQPRLPNVDNIAEVLSILEGDTHK
jgi:hypothetical protein